MCCWSCLSCVVVGVKRRPQACWRARWCCRCCCNRYFVLQRMLCYLNQLAQFVGSVAIAQFFYCFGAVRYCCHHFVRICDGGSGDILWLKCIVSVKRSFLVDLCGIYVFGSVLVMSIITIHWQCGIPMCLFCMFFCVLLLVCLLVIVEFFYSHTVRSDGRMQKKLELHSTDATGWLLFRTVVGLCPTITAENLVLCLRVHWGSVPRNSLWPLLLHFCGVCLVVISLAVFCIHPVLLSSGLLTFHCPVYVFSELFLFFASLASLICTIAWVPRPCNSWWVRLVSHCCRFIPSPWCICCLVVSVLGTALSGWRRQCSLLCTRWCIRHVPCILVVLLFWAPQGGCV